MIQSKSMEKPLTSVYLIRSNDNTLHPWFCPNCRNIIIRYKGDVVNIYPSETEATFPIVVQCANKDCKNRYQFLGFSNVVGEMDMSA